MPRTAWLPLLLLALFGLLLLANRAYGEGPPPPTLGELLAQQRLAIEIGPAGIAGPGAELLLREAGKARYVLIGEEHGLAEIPQLTRAIFEKSSPGFEIYGAEIGNLAAEQVTAMAKDSRGLPAFDDFQRKFPFAIPFVVFQEDAQLAALAARSGKLVGLDQEFLLGTVWLLGEVEAALRPLSAEAADQAAATLAEEQGAFAAIISSGNPEVAQTFVNRPLPPDWPRWKALLAGKPEAARALRAMNALEETRLIYELYDQQQYHQNNDRRGKVMKAHWQAATASPDGCSAGGRALVRLGANHVMRGMSPLGISDLGNFLAELATAQGAESLHVLVLPISGTLNAWLPFLPPEAVATEIDAKAQDYDFYRELLDAVPAGGGRAVYDLRPLRDRHRRLSKGHPNLEKVLLGYDLLVVIDNGHPATLLPSLAELAATPRKAP